MQINNTIKFYIWQAPKAAISTLASLRVGFESIKASKRARIACWVILSVLALTLWTLVTFRVAQRDAQRSFETWKERFVDDYLSMQEAARMGFPPDPKAEYHKSVVNAWAQLMEGLSNYNYSLDDFRTLLRCANARVRNPSYPDTLIEVIQQPGQWPGYSEKNEVTAKGKATAEKLIAELEAEEYPVCSSNFVYASFEREGITLRDTWEIGTRTHFWRAGE